MIYYTINKILGNPLKKEELLKCLKDGHCIGAARLLSVEEPLFVRKHCRSLMTYLI